MKNKKGAAAVFLLMILSAVFCVVAVLLEGACMFSAGSGSEGICDLAGRSVLSGYHRGLKDGYGLFGLYVDRNELEKDMSYYIDAALKEEGGQEGKARLTALDRKEIAVDPSEFLLVQPRIIEDQIVEYMKYRAVKEGLDLFQKEEGLRFEIQESAAASKLSGEKKEEAEEAERQQQEADQKKEEEGQAEGEGQSQEEQQENKRREKEKKRLFEILKSQKKRNGEEGYFEDGQGSGNLRGRVLRNKKITSQLPSQLIGESSMLNLKELLTGNIEELLLSGRDALMVNEYILSQFSNGANRRNGAETFFKNEVEYILCGHKADRANQQQVRYYLFTLRTGLNLAHIYRDAEKRQLTLEAALAIAPGPAAPAVQLLIASIWAGAESESDISTLLSGGKVPFLKTQKDWHLDLDTVLSGEAHHQQSGESSGQTYEDYLRFFLFLSNKETHLLRLMDLIQINMQLRWREDFRAADYCGGFFYRVEFIRKRGPLLGAAIFGGKTVEKIQLY